MKQLLQEIREAFHLSQERFANLLGTTFATVNRWENGRTIPGKKTQDKIVRLCSEYGVPLHELVMENIQKESAIPLEPDRILLYHGSKSGLSGAIAPISRDKCDFGRGFYSGIRSGGRTGAGKGRCAERQCRKLCDTVQSI